MQHLAPANALRLYASARSCQVAVCIGSSKSYKRAILGSTFGSRHLFLVKSAACFFVALGPRSLLPSLLYPIPFPGTSSCSASLLHHFLATFCPSRPVNQVDALLWDDSWTLHSITQSNQALWITSTTLLSRLDYSFTNTRHSPFFFFINLSSSSWHVVFLYRNPADGSPKMAFAFHPKLETPTSRYDEQRTITPRQALDDQDGTRAKMADIWPTSSFAMPKGTLGADSWKADDQPICSSRRHDDPKIDASLASQLNKCMDLDSGGARLNAYHPAPWHTPHDQARRKWNETEKWHEDVAPPPGMPGAATPSYRGYPTTPMHQRFASGSSGFYADDRYVAASEPGSDISSEYSDFFSASGLPLPPNYIQASQEVAAASCVANDAQHTALPDFVVEELKRLKLENMALRRMAQEVVRINIGPGALDGHSTDRRSPGCGYHPPLTSPPRFRRVQEGANPLQVYHEAEKPPTAAQASCVAPKERGTAASMWAPSQRAADPLNTSTPGITGGGEFKSSMVSEAELSRRVAKGQAETSFSGLTQSGATASHFGSSPSAVSLPYHLRSKPASSRTSPRSSPGSTLLIPSRLENASAATLVGMILDKRGQEASLLLQQQLKNGSPQRQEEIVDAIYARIVPLSHDRHGNFLVQGAIEMRAETAKHLKGTFVELTMSQFGCHVVQKALEGDEAVREAVIEELLGSRLEQTLTSRHSIHVWQRILETESTRPHFREKIFGSINRQLKGRWARTARQETGSIICQNIFESAQPAEKAMCMLEVLEELDECATNQWGVWVVQHIIEHGAEEERKSALRGLVQSASKLTLSLYGQKAVMSGLKTGDGQFLHEYVDALCQSSQPRRPPLIDVCLAPHGVQIVTQLLTTVDTKTRERIISTVRRNSVFLKGSKTGMKVHQLCERARAFAGY